MPAQSIYQFYAKLDDFSPQIWRQFQVVDTISVARLGYIVQVLFEMTASHLMAIEVPKGKNFKSYFTKTYDSTDIKTIGGDQIVRYDIYHEDVEEFEDMFRNVKVEDAPSTKLKHAIHYVGDKMSVEYDFGDGWVVSLKLEKIIQDKELSARELPRVLDGAGFGIVEDIGGTSGLDAFATAFQDKKGADYKHFSQWMGITDFDINAFDLDDMNFRVKKIPRIYKQCYENRLIPTQKSIDLIERAYLK